MNLPHQLSLIVQRAQSFSAILDGAVETIAREMGMDVCSIYLLDPSDWQLRLMATHGLDPSAVGKVRLPLGQGLTGIVAKEMRSLAVDDASSHPGFLYFPETREERFRSFLGVPMALRNRPVGAIVVQTVEQRSYSREDILTLSTIAAQLVGVVENARIIDALDRGTAGNRFLTEVRNWHSVGSASVVTGAPPRVDLTLHGGAAAPGIAIGEVAVRGTEEAIAGQLPTEFSGQEAEKELFEEALEVTRSEVVRIQKDAEKATDEEHAFIFSSHLMLLNDPVLLERVAGAIERSIPAARATFDVLEEFADRLRKVNDPYIQERIEDILDLRARLVGHLSSGREELYQVAERIVITRRAPPSLIVELKAQGARALVTETGGVTSHAALLARSMGIPAVTGVPDITALVRRGDHLVVDGAEGVVIVRPTPEIVERYDQRARHAARLRSENLAFCNLPARTSDGHRVEMLANVGVAGDLTEARAAGAQGVGLYRTEFPFIIREQFPNRDEQIRIYRRAYEAFPDGPVVFRLLDLGGDKFVPGGGVSVDRNPFHGYRSIRVLRDHPGVLRRQVQAFAIAGGERQPSILVPLVGSVEDILEVRERILEAIRELPPPHRDLVPRIGAMIELPAAVEIARELASVADFFSIGTNDLIQYTLAVDRENPRLASTRDPCHPAIVRMLRRTVDAAREAEIPVGVCGEIAVEWRLSLLLIAMGVDSLSIGPTGLPELKKAIATHSLEPARSAMDRILSLAGPREVRAALLDLYPDDEGDR